MPAGDSVLYCGNDKHGLLHIQARHGKEWQDIADTHSPIAGNWRYLADYAIGATLAVLNYLGHVRAVVGKCVVHIMPMGTRIDLSKLADVALDIGRTVGCSAYQNDFTLPEVPEEWRNQPAGWYTEGFPPYLPGLTDPRE